MSSTPYSAVGIGMFEITKNRCSSFGANNSNQTEHWHWCFQVVHVMLVFITGYFESQWRAKEKEDHRQERLRDLADG
jgi:hypothetical protein